MTTDAAPQPKFLGLIEVDSGGLLLGDPVYCLPRSDPPRPGVPYEAILGLPDAPAQPLAGQPILLLGHFGGDGTFPVYGEFDEDGVLWKATIYFVDPEE